MLLLRILMIFACLGAGGLAVAQDDTLNSSAAGTTADDPYFALRRSKDRARQLTAQRYLNLVKPQEWSDATGKFRTVAKYVDHDPDMTWVMLEAASGRGQDRVAKQKKVPFAKLSKKCQSRVRQIDRLKPRMDELIIAEAADKKKDAEGEGAAPGETYGERLAGTGPESAGEDGVEIEGEGALNPENPGAMDLAMIGREAMLSGMPPQGPPVDRTQWRTSLTAFQQNISIAPGPDGMPQLDWGELHELRALSDALGTLSNGAPADRERGDGAQRVADAAAAVGEVTWKASYLGLAQGLLGKKPIFAVPPLAPPVGLQFILADPQHSAKWAKLRPGQTVRFDGQPKMTTPRSIVVWVRMSDETAAEVDAQTASLPPAAPGAFVPTPENPR